MTKSQKSVLAILGLTACAIFCGLVILLSVGLYLDLEEDTARAETSPPERTFYFCGISRCRDSGTYGEMVLPTGINVWKGPDPERIGIHHTASHGDKAVVIREARVNDGPGGLWFELKGGGWTNDLHVTDKICTFDNLEQYSFTDCLGGRY